MELNKLYILTKYRLMKYILVLMVQFVQGDLYCQEGPEMRKHFPSCVIVKQLYIQLLLKEMF